MPPLTVMIKPVSMRCNMACGYCFYADVSSHRAIPDAGVMSDVTLETLLRRAYAYAEGELSLLFQGGEPTLAGAEFYEHLLELEKHFARPHLRVHNAIQTNGLALSTRMLDVLEQGRFLVGVSCDGPVHIHDAQRPSAAGQGTYTAVASTMEALRGRGIDYNVLCVVTAASAPHAEEIFSNLSVHGFLQFIPCMEPLFGHAEGALTPHAWGEFLCRTFDLYYAAWERCEPVSVRLFDNYVAMLMGAPPESCAMCGCCQSSYVVEADGSVYPCDFYCTDEYRIGSIVSSGFFTLAKSPTAAAFRIASKPVPESCLACRWRELCRNGCRRERKELLDGTFGLWRWCKSTQMLFEYAYGRMERMARVIAEQNK